ncbi:MAG: dihydroorotate dehydrogenase (fumarate) [Candidatus Paceibacteria bacterium]|jgi:dihydroorotate dehydrogenase (fumarate)
MSYIEKIAKEFPVGNAAGWCKSVKEVSNLAASAAQFIVVGSITAEERQGNPGNTFDGESLNSLGMPNLGIEKIIQIGPQMIRIAHKAGKAIILNVAAVQSLTEFKELVSLAVTTGFDGVELNTGCPNLVVEGKRKPIASHDPSLVGEIANQSKDIAKYLKPTTISVCLS